MSDKVFTIDDLLAVEEGGKAIGLGFVCKTHETTLVFVKR